MAFAAAVFMFQSERLTSAALERIAARISHHRAPVTVCRLTKRRTPAQSAIIPPIGETKKSTTPPMRTAAVVQVTSVDATRSARAIRIVGDFRCAVRSTYFTLNCRRIQQKGQKPAGSGRSLLGLSVRSSGQMPQPGTPIGPSFTSGGSTAASSASRSAAVSTRQLARRSISSWSKRRPQSGHAFVSTRVRSQSQAGQ